MNEGLCDERLKTRVKHDCVVDRITDLFRTTHKVKTQQVSRSRGLLCGDIVFTDYLVNVVVPVSSVLDSSPMNDSGVVLTQFTLP